VSLLETSWMDGWMNGECDNVANNCFINQINAKTETSPYSSTNFMVYRRNRSEKVSPTNEGPWNWNACHLHHKINDSVSCHIKGRVVNACCSILDYVYNGRMFAYFIWKWEEIIIIIKFNSVFIYMLIEQRSGQLRSTRTQQTSKQQHDKRHKTKHNNCES